MYYISNSILLLHLLRTTLSIPYTLSFVLLILPLVPFHSLYPPPPPPSIFLSILFSILILNTHCPRPIPSSSSSFSSSHRPLPLSQTTHLLLQFCIHLPSSSHPPSSPPLPDILLFSFLICPLRLVHTEILPYSISSPLPFA